MMTNFADRLIEQIKQKNSRVIVGLDPRLDLIPVQFKPARAKTDRAAAECITGFNQSLINLFHHEVAGIKPQSAFYEKYGHWGVKAFFDTIGYAKKKNLLVIADVKRGDVPSTAQAYAEAYLGKPALIDAITVNPLLGQDSLEPFIKLAGQNGRGLFALVKTSNPGSKDFQDVALNDGRLFYELLARKMAEWGKPLTGRSGYSSLGAVVGATFPAELAKLRQLMPHNFFLIPGYGAQGGRAEDIKNAFNQDGLGALITASRSITYAFENPKTKDWQQKVKDAVKKMNQEINALLI